MRILVATGFLITLFCLAFVVGCNHSGRDVRYRSQEPTQVSLYGWGLATGYVKVDLRTRDLQVVCRCERKGLSGCHAMASASEVSELRRLISESSLRRFDPKPDWFRRTGERLKDDPDATRNAADWSYSLVVSWGDETRAFHVLPRDWRDDVPQDAQEEYERIDAISDHLLDLRAPCTMDENRLTKLDRRAIDAVHSEMSEVAKASLPDW